MLSNKGVFQRLFTTALFYGLFALLSVANVLAEAENPDSFAIGLNPERNYLIMVNEANEYEFGGDYDTTLQDDLIYVADCYGIPTPVEKGANLAFTMLKQKLLAEDDIRIELYSAYRTKEDQQWVFDNYGNMEGWSETNRVMEPGFSEHHTGLMIEIVIWAEDENGDMVWMTETPERQADHPEFAKVHQRLADFGFIERYPEAKTDITGVPYEPYEIRFIGSAGLAHGIMDNELCLEEYLAIVQHEE